VPGEAGGHPDDDHLLAAPPLPLLHQHPSRPHLPLDLPAGSADAGRVASTGAESTRLLLRRGGAPLEEPLGVPQLDHGCSSACASCLLQWPLASAIKPVSTVPMLAGRRVCVHIAEVAS
jgi:hypothetical protein